MAEPALLVAQALTRTFGDAPAVRALTFTVERGAAVGFVGHNGAGKSTTMRMLAGALQPTSGAASVLGQPCGSIAARRLVGWLPETPPLHGELTVLEQLRYACALKGRPAREASALLERCGLGDVRRQLNATLSKGTKQRVGLAQALAGDPPVLLLDEPTAGLDPEQTATVRALVRALAQERAVLLSTHLVHEVAAVCDRVLLLRQGELVLDAPVASLGAGGLEATILARLAPATPAAAAAAAASDGAAA